MNLHEQLAELEKKWDELPDHSLFGSDRPMMINDYRNLCLKQFELLNQAIHILELFCPTYDEFIKLNEAVK